MAKLILTDADSGDTAALTTGLDWQVTGTNGVDDIILAAGATADLNLLGGEDTVVFAGNAADYTVSVAGTTVTLTHSSGAAVTIPASTTANTVTFADGETAALVIDTGAGTVNLGTQVITDTAAAISGTVAGDIPDLGPFNPPTVNPAFSVSAIGASEGETATFTITLTQPQSTSTTVDYTVGFAGTASAADHGDITVDGTVDNTGTGTITFLPGEVSKTVTVAIAQDEESPEEGEGITLTLANPAGVDNLELGTETATADITDVPVTFTLTANATSVQEGQQITYTLTASQNLSADTVVSFSVVPDDTGAANQGTNSTNLNDFASGSFNPADKTIVAGTNSVSYTVTAQSDGITELPESYTVKAVLDGVEYTVDTTLLDAPVTQFTLTTGIDDINGTELDETIIGSNNATGGTLTALDDIDGGLGTDTLLITQTDNNTFTLPGTITVANVEKVTIQHTTDNVADTATINTTTGFTGLQSISYTQAGTAAPVDVDTNGNATSVTVSGGTTVAVDDNATTDTLTTLSVSNATGAVTVGGTNNTNLTTLNMTNANGGATITSTAGTRTLNVNLNKLTAGTITDANATTVNVAATGAATTGVTLTAGAATSVSIDADEKLTLADVNIGAATTLTVTGDSLVTISATTGVAALTKLDASATTGGLNVTPALGNSVVFLGGAGNDGVQFGASTVATSMGAGDDTVTLSGSALGGGSVDAGTGTDTLSMTSANAATASAATTFEGTISNFEALLLGATGAADTVNLANLDDISMVTSAGVTAGGLTLQNLGATNSLTFTGLIGAASSVALADTTGTTDTLNLKLAATDGFTSTAALTAANIEVLNITTDDTDTTAPTTVFTQQITAAAATTVKVTGDVGANLTGLTSTKLTSFDASGVTATGAAGAVTLTTGALEAAATLSGGAGDDVLSAAASTKSVTLNGNAGNDTLTASNNGSTINGGDGNDTITGGTGTDIINGGAGNDTITSGGGAGLDQITTGTGTDTVILAASTQGTAYATILDATSGDKLQFTDQGAETFATAKITLGANAVFQDYIDAAAAGDGSTNGAISWFQFNNNTYLVEDLSAGATFNNGTDLVVELTGLVDLSTATGAGTNVLTLA